jgi:hypothetical protein
MNEQEERELELMANFLDYLELQIQIEQTIFKTRELLTRETNEKKRKVLIRFLVKCKKQLEVLHKIYAE